MHLRSQPCCLSIQSWSWHFCKELQWLLQVKTGMHPASPGPWHREFRPVQWSRNTTSAQSLRTAPLNLLTLFIKCFAALILARPGHAGELYNMICFIWRNKSRRLVYFCQTAVPCRSLQKGKKSCNVATDIVMLSFISFDWRTVWGPDRGFICNNTATET